MSRVWIAAIVVLAACSGGSELSSELRPAAIERVTALSDRAGITLSVEDADCVAGELDDTTAIEINEAAPRTETLQLVGEALVECVGQTVLGDAALRPQADGVRQDSLDCAADRLDRDFVVDLVVNAMEGSELSGARVELEVVSAFSVCLGVDELGRR